MNSEHEDNLIKEPHKSSKFRCPECGYEILDESGHPLLDLHELARWLLSNSEQPVSSLPKCGEWTEGSNSPVITGLLLQKAGFELTFDDDESGWRLERWEHPDGQYRLMAFHGNGLCMTDSVEDEAWRGILDLLSIHPDWSYMQDVFELVVYDSDEEIIEGETLQPGKAPETETEWQEVVQDWLSDPSTTKEPGTTLALLDRRTDKNLFTHTFE